MKLVSSRRPSIFSLIAGLCAGIAVVGAVAQESAQPETATFGKSQVSPGVSQGEDVLLTSLRILQEVKPSIVQVFWPGERRRNDTDRTPGFVVSGGMVLSVRKSATVTQEVIVRHQEADYDGHVVLVDPASGLVVIEGLQEAVPPVPPLQLGASRDHLIGDPLFALDLNEQGRAERCVVGALIGRDRKLEGEPLPIAYLRPQVPEVTSEGGLPIFDAARRVIAIDLGVDLDDDGEEFHALPVEVASKLLGDLEDFGKREDSWLGITFNTGTTTPKVVSVRNGSPGDRAGILPGDVVIEFAGARIDTLDDLADVCYTLTPGRNTEIQVLRGVSRVQRTLKPISTSMKPLDPNTPVAAPRP